MLKTLLKLFKKKEDGKKSGKGKKDSWEVKQLKEMGKLRGKLLLM